MSGLDLRRDFQPGEIASSASVAQLAARCVLRIVLAWVIAAPVGASVARAQADTLVSADYPFLSDALGDDVPLGTGLTVAHIDAKQGESSRYLPDETHVDFLASSDPSGQPTIFTDLSNLSGAEVSDHATNMGRRFYGNSPVFSMAREANNVLLFEANDWMLRCPETQHEFRPHGGRRGRPEF